MSIISSVINDIDNATNESTMSTLCAMAESYDKMQMITESCDRTCDLSEFSVFQEAKQQQEGFFKRIINLIKGFFTAIFNRITGKKNPANKKEILDNIQKAKKADKSKRAAIFGALLGAAGGAAAGAVGTKMASKSKLNEANEANETLAKKNEATNRRLAEAEKANETLAKKNEATNRRLAEAQEANLTLAKAQKDAKAREAYEAELIERINKLNGEITDLKKMNEQRDSDKKEKEKEWESEKAKYQKQIETITNESQAISANSKKYNDALNSLIKTVMDVYGPGDMTNLLGHMTNNWSEPVQGLDTLRKIVNKFDTEFDKKRKELSRTLKFKVETNDGSGLITYDSAADEVLCNFDAYIAFDLYETLCDWLEKGVDLLDAILTKKKTTLESYKRGYQIKELNSDVKYVEDKHVKRNVPMHKIDIEKAVEVANSYNRKNDTEGKLKKFNDLSGKITDELINEIKAEYPEAIDYFIKLNSELPKLSSFLQGYIDLINMAVKEYNEIIVKSGLISDRLSIAPRLAIDNVRMNGSKKVNNSTSQPKSDTGDKTDKLTKAKAEYKKAVEDFVNEYGKKPTRKKARQMSSEIIKKYGLESGTVIWESVEEFIDDEDEVVRDSSTSWYY